MPAILGRRSHVWHCDASFGRSFPSETAKVLVSGCEKCCYVGCCSSIVDITGAKEMCSVSVSRSKVLRLLVAVRRWKCGV